MTTVLPRSREGLALAVATVSAATADLLLVEQDLTVLAVSDGFCRTFGIDRTSVEGQSIFTLGSGEWATPLITSMLTTTVSGGGNIDAYEVELCNTTRGEFRLSFDATMVRDTSGNGDLMLVAVTDPSETRMRERERESLFRDQGVLLQELQHRTANSLQIIASVLMQSARKTSSDELRGYLHDAHHRVMSVAEVQKQLAVTTLGSVALRPYLSQLCANIGASLIYDPAQLEIVVDAEDANIAPELSVSVGLVVTELVINALKHAFPGQRRGRIDVGYRSTPMGWTLTVADDGVGMPRERSPGGTGLGTSIVEALAKQLRARIDIGGSVGTKVTLAHVNLRVVAGTESELRRAV
ncbi:ATP-binding protein [Polymorphobacter sp. PAMC 29334]|uniref:histidine kinase dimerization/phosphoacceptor domain -containing protein n=1 Tax=Polymorphobacter sp. PAMC 29334 TaxID=2862331 RepID=UPI001C767385|nr:histidine kinase dimerization/phosphoacceptor domain -containing protein [Polymorphobacter sp. PAMC 29334]QYE34089.1 ATP-binding protein [Polymorphobacter sp. PAMC 29334]